MRVKKANMTLKQQIETVLNEQEKAALKRQKRAAARREREEVMRSLGLTRVRGNLGGTYWE